MKKNIKYIICILFLIFNIFGTIINIKAVLTFSLEIQTVYITSDVQETIDRDIDGNKIGTTYWVRYDNHNGEQGILYTKDVKKGDVITVYRNKNTASKNDSTHGWSTTIRATRVGEIIASIIFVVFTVINIVILYKLKRTNKYKKGNK